MLSHPQAKPIPDPLIPASAGSWGQGSHHTCVTIVFSLAPCPPHGELLEDLLAAWNILVPTKSGKHRCGSLVPHRCSEHVHCLMTDDKVRYTEQCSCWYFVNLFAANNIHEKSGYSKPLGSVFIGLRLCLSFIPTLSGTLLYESNTCLSPP